MNAIDGSCSYNKNGCIRRNITNSICTKCSSPYVLDEGVGLCLKIANYSHPPNEPDQKSDPSSKEESETSVDQNCIKKSPDNKTCAVCVSRMYYSAEKAQCVSVDANCKAFVASSGKCLECYDGYSTSADEMVCQLSKPKDINCKLFTNGTSICSECYSGFYWDAARGLCTVVDQLCKSSDARNGACLSCWSGYTLSNSKCIIETVSNRTDSMRSSNGQDGGDSNATRTN